MRLNIRQRRLETDLMDTGVSRVTERDKGVVETVLMLETRMLGKRRRRSELNGQTAPSLATSRRTTEGNAGTNLAEKVTGAALLMLNSLRANNLCAKDGFRLIVEADLSVFIDFLTT